MPRFFPPFTESFQKKNTTSAWESVKQMAGPETGTTHRPSNNDNAIHGIQKLGEIPAGATGEIWDAFPWSFKKSNLKNDSVS